MNYWNPRIASFIKRERDFDVLEFHSASAAIQELQVWKADKAGTEHASAIRQPDWAGIIGETYDDYLRNRGAQRAIQDFREAKASLTVRSVPGSMQARPNGGAWVIPEVIQGLPLPARVRPRTKLPPKDFRVHLSVSAGVEFKEIARVSAKIARTAWDYMLRGGVSRVTFLYENGYHKPSKRGTKGCVIMIHAPLSSEWELAQACSVQTFRAIAIPFSQALSGEHADSLRVSAAFATDNVARIGGLMGQWGSQKDDKELEKIGIF